MQREPRSPPQQLPPTASSSPSPLLAVGSAPGGPRPCREGGCVWFRREKGGSEVLLENKLHPFSIFIRREGSEQSSVTQVCGTTQVCVNGDNPFLFFKFIFVSVLVLFKQSFVSSFIFLFFFFL